MIDSIVDTIHDLIDDNVNYEKSDLGIIVKKYRNRLDELLDQDYSEGIGGTIRAVFETQIKGLDLDKKVLKELRTKILRIPNNKISKERIEEILGLLEKNGVDTREIRKKIRKYKKHFNELYDVFKDTYRESVGDLGIETETKTKELYESISNDVESTKSKIQYRITRVLLGNYSPEKNFNEDDGVDVPVGEADVSITSHSNVSHSIEGKAPESSPKIFYKASGGIDLDDSDGEESDKEKILKYFSFINYILVKKLGNKKLISNINNIKGGIGYSSKDKKLNKGSDEIAHSEFVSLIEKKETEEVVNEIIGVLNSKNIFRVCGMTYFLTYIDRKDYVNIVELIRGLKEKKLKKINNLEFIFQVIQFFRLLYHKSELLNLVNNFKDQHRYLKTIFETKDLELNEELIEKIEVNLSSIKTIYTSLKYWWEQIKDLKNEGNKFNLIRGMISYLIPHYIKNCETVINDLIGKFVDLLSKKFEEIHSKLKSIFEAKDLELNEKLIEGIGDDIISLIKICDKIKKYRNSDSKIKEYESIINNLKKQVKVLKRKFFNGGTGKPSEELPVLTPVTQPEDTGNLSGGTLDGDKGDENVDAGETLSEAGGEEGLDASKLSEEKDEKESTDSSTGTIAEETIGETDSGSGGVLSDEERELNSQIEEYQRLYEDINRKNNRLYNEYNEILIKINSKLTLKELLEIKGNVDNLKQETEKLKLEIEKLRKKVDGIVENVSILTPSLVKLENEIKILENNNNFNFDNIDLTIEHKESELQESHGVDGLTKDVVLEFEGKANVVKITKFEDLILRNLAFDSGRIVEEMRIYGQNVKFLQNLIHSLNVDDENLTESLDSLGNTIKTQLENFLLNGKGRPDIVKQIIIFLSFCIEKEGIKGFDNIINILVTKIKINHRDDEDKMYNFHRFLVQVCKFRDENGELPDALSKLLD